MSLPWNWLVDYLVCPVCGSSLRLVRSLGSARDGVFGHAEGDCQERYPLMDGIPRMLVGAARGRLFADRRDWFEQHEMREVFASWSAPLSDAPDLRLVRRFDREWRAFPHMDPDEQAQIFGLYFNLVPQSALSGGRVLVDAGCGGGRWAFEAQRQGAKVIAVDLGMSIEVAAHNTAQTGRVACVQADIRRLPIRSDSADLVYSLGVLHHIEETEAALRELVRVTRRDGFCLVYLYYALETRSVAYRAIFRVADLIRQASSALPQPILTAFATAVAAGIYLPLARSARLFELVGLPAITRSIPLNFYARLSFRTMRNDSLDRFGTGLEKRFRREEVRRLLEDAGLADVVISPRPPYWHALGRKL